MSLTVTIEFSNEGARTAAQQMADFEEYMNSKMAGEVPDPTGAGALGWVMGHKIRQAIQAEINAQDKKFAQEEKAKLPPPPSIRERRRAWREQS